MNTTTIEPGCALLLGAAKVESAMGLLQLGDGPTPEALKGIYRVGGHLRAGDVVAARLSAIAGDWEGVGAEFALGVCGLLDSGCVDAVKAVGAHLQGWAVNWCEVTGYEGELQ